MEAYPLSMLLTIVGVCAGPPPDPTKCHEQCIVSPTGCASRSECGGCGALCFDSYPEDPGYDKLLQSTGTSLQASSISQCFTGRDWEANVRSADLVLSWKKIEPSPGTHDWSDLTAAVARAQKAGKKLSMLLWTGQFSPEWLYTEFGVERLAWNDGHNFGQRAPNDTGRGNFGQSVPNYMNLDFQKRLKQVHMALKAVLQEYNEPGNAVIALQPCVGSTGDDTPVHADAWTHVNHTLLNKINSPGSGSGTWWNGFFSGFGSWLYSEVFPNEIAHGNFSLLVNAQGTSFPLDWVAKKLPGTFLKFGQTGHEYQSNYERFRAASFLPYTYSIQRGRVVRSRAELSSETCWTTGGKYFKPECYQPWNFYAMTQWVATAHLDFWNVQPGAGSGFINNMTYAPLWKFLNRYAGLRWARQASGGWIGFRDGLDAMDTIRFNESYYGKLSVKHSSQGNYPEVHGQSNKLRASKICGEFTDHNCHIDVPDALVGGPMAQRRAGGMNDVAFGHWQGDYGCFLSQTRPENSRGWWRVGPASQMFGRFARGFASPQNPSATIGLKFDRGLWGGLPLTRKLHLKVRLVFYDAGKGTFSIHYDAASGRKRLTTVRKRGSQLWKELCQDIPDAKFGGSGPEEADIWITNDDQEDDIFDSLEVSDSFNAMQDCDWIPDDVTIVV